MKYIKTYENISNEPQVGDYVISIPKNIIPGSEDFFNNSIGIITKISKEHCGIEYENIPKFISKYYCSWRQGPDGKQYQENVIWFNLDMIKYYGKSKDEVKLKNTTDKYNL